MKGLVARIMAAAVAIGMLASARPVAAGDLLASARAAVEASEQARRATPNDWQRDYDKARDRKAGGKGKIIKGAILMAAGIGIRQWAANRCVNNAVNFANDFDGDIPTCSLESNLVTAGNYATLGGVGVVGWGVTQYILASGEVRRLEAEASNNTNTTALQPAPSTMARGSGPAASASYSVRW